MCGIAGLVYVDRSRNCHAQTVTSMCDVVTYRGPDDAGVHLDGPAGLGHRRLSIIDVGGGHQPMSDDGGTASIVFNGEIFNYRQLREEMMARGHRFRTSSDTEVILSLYRERGPSCVTALNGMFAFAIWDSRSRSLFLARDRMGVKPLYFAETPDAFVFASEIKSLFASGIVPAACREEAIAEYLQFRQLAGTESFFKGVRSVPPGCTMTVQDGRAITTRYWSLLPTGSPAKISREAAIERLTELLEDSVRLRLISDVPVGTFCSGGVDSSLVTAIASRLKGGGVNTFSVGFDEADYDESAFATSVSERYRTVHHRLRLGNADFDRLFPKMVWHNDEPLDFANSIHIFALSELAKRYVTVVLTGEGADELFAGYPRYRIPSLAGAYRHVPSPLRRLIGLWSGDHRLHKLDRYATLSPDDRLLYNSSYIPPDAVAAVCPGRAMSELAFRRQCLHATVERGDPVARLSLLDQQTFLVSVLNRQDKMSMAASVESRVPFMDYRIVEFANSLPDWTRRGTAKGLVKAVARPLLPAAVVDRRKSGFGVPLDRWFRANDGLGARLLDLPDHPAADVFDRKVLRTLVAEHRSGRADHSDLLWAALNLCMWREAFHV